MIIDDATEGTTLKPSQRPPSPHESLELPPSPPPYFSYQAIPPPVTILAPRWKKPKQRKSRRRKCFVLASVALNCLLFVLLLRLGRHGQNHDSESGEDDEVEVEVPEPEHRVVRAVVPNPRLGRCTQNATWSSATRLSDDHFQYSSDASFQFPDSASLTFLLAQGALSGGDFHVLPSFEPLPHAVLQVRYHSQHVRDRANVCLMERKHANGAGIGIFTPAPFDGQSQKDQLDFTITLFLPTGDSSSTSLPTYNLETRLPSFAHTLDSLKGVLEFDHLNLRSKNKPIVVQSLSAKNATIQTSNGRISGSFEASSSLSLVTSNAPIDASITLHSTNIFGTTNLVLQTRNADLESAISLVTSAATGEGGKFSVKAETADAPLVMTFPKSPVHSLLNLDAQTTNSPADVWLNHAFEGEFALASSMVLVDRRPFLDPRKLRTVLYSDYQNGMVTGNVLWKLPIFKSKVRGSVRVSTTNHILKFYV
ncbi:hypothetical protein FB451DRAFT_1208687 [Mycena latifolia]|nr:hypothetical protein FB451DRAFT_1208687 [Mycena latifolia]